MENPKARLAEEIGELDELEAVEVLDFIRELRAREVQEEEMWRRLKEIPGVRLPRSRRPRFDRVTPIKVIGEPASEMLSRDRG